MLGLIEGFYGHKFKDDKRRSLLSYLKDCGYEFYIYAPKEERNLRQDFLKGLPKSRMAKLLKLRTFCKDTGLKFGLGLSPYNLSGQYAEQRDRFLEVVKEQYQALSPEIFCLLFDDQPLDCENAAKVQHQIIVDALERMPEVERFIICPTYYTFDPILEKLFGPRPENYFTDLMAGMPDKVEVFWTGPKILSPDITPDDLKEAEKVLGRKPFIWDNYPVNDGKAISQFLFLKPFNGRRGLEGLCSGHAVNPMLECELNKVVLKTLAMKYQGKTDEEINAVWEHDLKEQLGAGADILFEQLHLLTERGLDKLNALQKAMLIAACELEDKSNPALEEIVDFLNNEYAFDPACLN